MRKETGTAGSDGRIESIGDRVEPGAYEIHSRFARAVNYTMRDRLASVVSSDVGAGPTNIVMEPWIEKTAVRIIVKSNVIVIGDVEYLCHRDAIYSSEYNFSCKSWRLFDHNVQKFSMILHHNRPEGGLTHLLATDPLKTVAGSFVQRLQMRFFEGLAKIRSGNILEGLRLFEGAGAGMTPSGDDFIIGILMALRCLEIRHARDLARLRSDIVKQHKGVNPVVRSMIQMSAAARFTSVQRNLIDGLFSGDDSLTDPAIRRFLRVGHASGADCAAGFLEGLSIDIDG